VKGLRHKEFWPKSLTHKFPEDINDEELKEILKSLEDAIMRWVDEIINKLKLKEKSDDKENSAS
jgi:hypothetical protein